MDPLHVFEIEYGKEVSTLKISVDSCVTAQFGSRPEICIHNRRD